MANLKRMIKAKFPNEDMSDFLNESQFLPESPKKKQTKRRKTESVEGDFKITPVIPKKDKTSGNDEVWSETRQKLINVLATQFETRKQIKNNLHKGFTDVLNQMEADYNALKDNEQKLEHLTSSFLKCMQQATAAHKQKIKSFQDIYSTFEKECEKAETTQKKEINKFAEDLEEDMNKLKEKLVSEYKRNSWEALRRSFFQAMQNDY
ncbi:uncharacterized protein LOC121732202 [Aricia agestis]|uniref:uncharacterized protein LOC121732202 n=1 Tax=Aricia agestis TaxID=91739 RepID=UPI001C207DDC|nr:uncharacterized protein LOC121732202 [Aricia agestis]